MEMISVANPITGEWLSLTGVIIAGALVALCVIFAIISSVQKKKKGNGKKK